MKTTVMLIPALLAAAPSLSRAASRAAVPIGIDALLAAEGADYVRLRDAALGRRDLEAWLDGQPKGDWRHAILHEALSLRAALPTVDAPLHHLRGLDPEVYLRTRRPEPAAGRELIDLAVPAAILMECYWKTADLISVHASDYPDELPADRVRALAAQERLALRSALLMAIGRSGHAAAARFLADAARDTNGSAAARGVAAASIGDTADPGAGNLLAELIASRDLEVVPGALRSAGKLRDEDGLTILARALDTFPDRAVRQVTLMGLAAYANPMTWGERTGVDESHGAHLREAAAKALVGAVSAPWAAGVRDSLIQALAASRHPSVTPALQALQADDRATPAARAIAAEALGLLEIAAARRR